MNERKIKKEISRLRSEVRKLQETKKEINPFTGIVSGNYWSQTGMPWVQSEGRKAVLTEFFWQPIRGQPRRVDTNELRQFAQTFWVNSCVKTLCDEIASIDWDIIPKEDIPYEAVSQKIKEIKEFLKIPNKNNESFSEIIKAVVKDILEIDAGVIVKVYDINSYDFEHLEPKSGAPLLKPYGQRRLVEIYARDGASFLKEIDKFGFVRGYWQYSYQIPAHPMWFNKEEICYISENNRSMSCYGYARTQAILDIIKSLHYSTLYNKRFFEETPIPDGALSLLDTNETEMQEFLNYWNNEFKAQPHKLAVINKEVKWQPFNISNRELEFLETQKWYYNMVIAMFGLSPAELGITDDLNKATSATQSELVKRKGIRPFLKLLEYFINKEILTELNPQNDIEFTFIYDDPGEKSLRLDNWQKELQMGVKTINEVRIEMGLQPVPYGDVPSGYGISFTQTLREPIQTSPEKAEEKIIESQEGNYEDIRIRETEEERRGKILNPFSQSNKPIGSFKSKSFSANLENAIRDISNQYNWSEEQVRRGIETELEHQGAVHFDEAAVIQAVIDHLMIDPNYYTKIVKGLTDDVDSILRENNWSKEEALIGFGIEQEHLLTLDYQDYMSDQQIWQIVFDHLKEDKNYYTKLIENRKKAKKGEIEELPLEKPGMGRSDKWWEIYHALRREGYSKERAAKIASSKVKEAKKNADVNSGQYYREPNEVIREPKGIITQPQEYRDTTPSQLVRDYRKPGIDTYPNPELDITCPMCGHNSVAQMTSADDINQTQKFRCTNCGAVYDEQEIIDRENLYRMTTLIQANPPSHPVSLPRWSPKGLNEDFSIKEWAGFDISKSFNYSIEFIKNKEYFKLLKELLNDLPEHKIKDIIKAIETGYMQGKTINQIAKDIDLIINDKERAIKIARTEIIRISNEGKRIQLKEQGVKEVEWVSAPEDGRLCKECKKHDKKKFKIDEIKNKIPLHPNCRCTFV